MLSFYSDRNGDEVVTALCDHPSITDGSCDECFCQVTVLDTRPAFSIGTKRVSSADYASGISSSIHGVIKTFNEKSNISDIPASTVAEVCALYDKVPGVMRGVQRMGVIAACLNQSLMKKGIFLSEKKILLRFGIEKKDLSNGESLLSTVTTLTVPDLPIIITSACEIIGIKNPKVVQQAIEFAKLLKPTHHLFIKISAPIVGAGFLYSFLELKPEAKKSMSKKKEFNIQTFSKDLDISKTNIKEIYLTVLDVIDAARAKEKGE